MVDPLNYFLFQPLLHNWFNKSCGMCYPVCGMVHIKEPLLLIRKIADLAVAVGFPSYLNGPLPYKCIECFVPSFRAGIYGVGFFVLNVSLSRMSDDFSVHSITNWN